MSLGNRLHVVVLLSFVLSLAVLVATASGNGRELPIDKGGPTRIIFTDGTEAGAASEQWIWSIKTIDVR